MNPEDIPRLPRGVRLHHDRVRGIPVLLGPERVLMLDEIGQTILTELDGRSIRAISGDLAKRYDAPVDAIQSDVIEFLTDLRAKWLVEVTHA